MDDLDAIEVEESAEEGAGGKAESGFKELPEEDDLIRPLRREQLPKASLPMDDVPWG